MLPGVVNVAFGRTSVPVLFDGNKCKDIRRAIVVQVIKTFETLGSSSQKGFRYIKTFKVVKCIFRGKRAIGKEHCQET